MSPITYKPNSSCEGGMEVHRYGRYVSVKEYNTLKAEVERLRKHGDAMAEALEAAGFNNARDFWNAAKEGKPSV